MVTPIDHFLLILNRADRIAPAAVAMRQQIAGLEHRRTAGKNQDIAIDFKALTVTSAPRAQLPLGKLFTRFCEPENRADQSIILLGADRNA